MRTIAIGDCVCFDFGQNREYALYAADPEIWRAEDVEDRPSDIEMESGDTFTMVGRKTVHGDTFVFLTGARGMGWFEEDLLLTMLADDGMYQLGGKATKLS